MRRVAQDVGGAAGSATGGGGDRRGCRAIGAGRGPATAMAPVMPAGMAGDRAQEGQAAGRDVTCPLTVAPGSAVSFVPSANVTSCSAAPVLLKVTW